MRQRAGWMTSSDDTILELLEESGLALNKKAMHVNFKARGISISYNTSPASASFGIRRLMVL